MSRHGGPAQRLADAARAFVATLDDRRRERACCPFPADDRRLDWHYVPRRRAGLALEAMSPRQRKLAHGLLAAVLRPHAYAQAATIMALEDVLDRAEGGRRDRRAGDYAVSVFGEPSAAGGWGWQLEGHHLSVNVTVLDGSDVSATPLFFGANPARVRHGDADILRPLPQEEEVARALLAALPAAARRVAIYSDDPPADIRTRNRPVVTGTLDPLGVCGADLSGAGAELLARLLAIYADRLAPDLAGGSIAPSVQRVWFAWAGSPEAGRPHYYRLQGGGLLVEYNNTQDGANHIHTVLRDPARDFGADLPDRRPDTHQPPR